LEAGQVGMKVARPARYGAYRVEQENTPRSLPHPLDLLRAVGFRQAVVLHKHGVFAALRGTNLWPRS
jgi:hypothetical protein